MGESQRSLNPGVLHFQKLGLELKCPSCLELYNNPILLPCNHIFCGCCVPEPPSECAVCKHSFINKVETNTVIPKWNRRRFSNTRQATFIENIVSIYRSLEVTFSPRMHQIASVRRSLSQSQSPLPSHSQTRLKQHGQADFMDFDQLNRLSQGSPPVGVNSSDLGSGEDSLERHPMKKSNKRLADEFTSNEVHSSTNSLADNSLKTFKKPKQENNGTGEMIDLHSPQTVKISKDHAKSEDKILSRTMVSSDSKAVHPSSSMDSLPFVCGFCQTWKVTEYTGPMVHYANENPVFDKEAMSSDVIHVHSRCIEWAPQIYYVNETAKNLNKELQRGAKLKCCKCKLKGATLGCYAKSCKRSYHVPCATEISASRWDTDNFLMLCPVHASLKFPNEKSSKQSSGRRDTNHDNPAQMETDIFDFWAASPTGSKKWIFCASSLSVDEKRMLIEFASICGASVMRSWSPAVTHVIAATDATGACTRTRKVLMSILKGKWVVKIDWIKACMEMKGPVDEEPYEVSLDNHGCSDGPKIGRLKAITNAPKLFSGLKFLFAGEFVRAYMEDLQDLIIAAGGTLLENKEQLRQNDSAEQLRSDPATRLIIYNCDSDMGEGDGSDVLQRQLVTEVLAAETRSQAIPHTWLLDSIGSCSLQSFAM